MGVTPVHAKDKDAAQKAPGVTPPAAAVSVEGPAAPVPVVRRLEVGAADDPAESSADAMADIALSRLATLSAADPEAHRHGAGCEHVRRTAAPSSGGAPVVGFAGGAVDTDTESRISSTLRRGNPLAAPVRRDMEQAFGRSFDAVRVHDNENAAGLNRAISARAFTTGNDIYFGAGQYRPQDPDGQRVLAHELAHVVQGDGAVHRWWPFGESEKKSQAQIDADAAAVVLKKQQTKEQKATTAQAAKEEKDAAAKAAKEKKDTAAQKAKADKEKAQQDRAERAAAEKANKDDLARRKKGLPSIGATEQDWVDPVGAGAAQVAAAAPGPVVPGQAAPAGPAAAAPGQNGPAAAAPAQAGPAVPTRPVPARPRNPQEADDMLNAKRAAAAGDKDATRILNKAIVGSSKSTLAKYDERQRLEGAQNLVDRAALSDEIVAGQMKGAKVPEDGEPQRTGTPTSARVNDLQHDMEAKLTQELEAIAAIETAQPKLPKDKVLALAYQQIWMAADLPKDLKTVRPNRSTDAARLAWATRAEMAKEAQKGDAAKPVEIAPLGSMLRKRVERTYEEIEVHYDRELAELKKRKSSATLSEDKLQNQARRQAKRHIPKAELDLLPTDAALDAQASIDARARLKLRPTPPKAVAPGVSGDDVVNAIDPDGTVGTLVKLGSKGFTAPLAQAGKKLDKAANPGASSGGGLQESIPGGLGNAIKTGRVAHESLESGKRSGEAAKTDQSDETLAGLGIGQSKDILLDIATAVTAIRNLLDAFASPEKSPRNKKKIAQEMANTGAAAMSGAVNAAKLSATISSGVSDAVMSVIPGLNIAKTFMTMTSKVLEVADIGQRMSAVNGQLNEAHERKPGVGLDVLVYPLIGIQESFVKKLETVVWDAGMSVLSFSTAIATVASAGGFGIPAAIDASAKVLDLLHKAGHFIADNVLASITQEARRATGNAIEGAAEQQLRKDPSAAVNNMVMAARQGNQHASAFIESFGFTPAQIKSEKIVNISAPILKIMGKDADPQTAFDKFESAMKSASAKQEKWKQTGVMAKQRDELDKKSGLAFDLGITSRGVLWRLEMMLRSEVKHNRSMRKTAVKVAADPVMGKRDRDAEAAAEAAKPVVGGFGDGQVLGTIGKIRLLANPSDQQKQIFAGQVKALPDEALEAALRHPANGDAFREFVGQILADRAQEKAKAAAVPAAAGAAAPAAAGAAAP